MRFIYFKLVTKLYVYFQNTTIMSLSEFTCSEVSLSFAWINSSRYSDFSPPIIICIRTGNNVCTI